jgi:hypothetical protein
MSVQASLDLNFQDYDKAITPINLITLLLNNGWSLNDNGRISYLPIGDNYDFDWIISSQISKDELMMMLEEKEKRNELIGIVLTWKNTNIGGSILFYPSDKISFVFNINRRILHGLDNFKMTDFNWYLSRILPIFNKNNIPLKSFVIDETR